MGAVVRLTDYRARSTPPTLVLIDLHTDFANREKAGPDANDLSAALDMCRSVLTWARQQNLPIAFVRHSPPLPYLLATHAYPRWIGGIEPRRSDMIFERAVPSCYGSSEFARMAERGSELVLAGLFGESACLSTLIDAHHRNHRFTFLADASCSRGHDAVSAREMHRRVVGLASLYGASSPAQSWMDKRSVQPRRAEDAARL